MPKQRRRGRLAATVELTPLIDIVFLLLIFFMVSTTFIRQNELAIELPEADSGARRTGEAAVELSIHRDGRYAVNGRPAGPERLSEALAVARANDAGGRLLIVADAATAHQAVVTALDAAGKAGLSRISIVTRRSEADDER